MIQVNFILYAHMLHVCAENTLFQTPWIMLQKLPFKVILPAV